MSQDFNGVTIGDDGTGFLTPAYQFLRPALTNLLYTLRGISNLNTAPGSFYGQLIDFVGVTASTALQNAGEAVAATQFTTARGANLDAVVAPFTTRLPATASTADLTLYADPGTNVPAGNTVRVNEVSELFATLASAGPFPAIGNSDNYVIEVAPFDAAAEAGETFTLTVDGNPFTRIVGALDTPQSIIDDLIQQVQNAALSQGALAIGVNPVNERAGARIAETQGLGVFPISFAYTGGAPLPFLFPAIQVASEAQVTGPTQAQALSLREIVTPVVGWQGVSNVNAAVPGEDEETDAELRLRHRRQLKGLGSSNPDAIKAFVERPIDEGGGGAIPTSVEYNKTDIIDGAGNLPHSIRVVVPQGSDPDAVANAIWARRSAGDNMNGAIQVFILDSEGNPQEVLYDELTPIFIWVQGIVAPGEGFSQVGDPLVAISEETAAFIESLPAGRDANPIQFPVPYNLEGQSNNIATYDLQVGFSLTELGPPIYNLPFFPSGTIDASAAAQPIAGRERARGDVTRITLVTP